MKKGRILAGVLALFTGAVYPAFFMHAETTYCEKIYDVKLSVDTVEVDINSIPENREVQVGVNIENNPGFLGMSFCIELDDNIEYDELKLFMYGKENIGICYGFHSENKIISLDLINDDIESLNWVNGKIFNLTLIIPETCKSGDYYSIKPILNYQDENGSFNASFNRENSFDTIMGKENFAEPVAGGIRIVGEQHQEQPPVQEPEQNNPEPAQPAEQPVQQEQSNNIQQNESQPANTESPKESTETTVSSSVSVSETVLTSEVTSVSETVVSTVSETICSETVSTPETEITENISAPQAERKSGKTAVIAASVSALIIAGISFILYRTRRKKN